MTHASAILWVASPLWTDPAPIRAALTALDDHTPAAAGVPRRWVTIGANPALDQITAWAEQRTITMHVYPCPSLPPGPYALAFAFIRNHSAPEMSVVRALRRDRVPTILASATIPEYTEILWQTDAARRPV